ncbi:flagellar hook-length control protein FliK [Pseudomonas ogarae]|uniref:Flagellar hook length control protein FliK n=1 Tax=Pseudomonas ogarae (strain DSM 112162 / CECT 30235 / F113) TaxID=1114970 RepID=A0ABM6QTP4_PSEO1|nr:flagellar hook-length control protein FliK [Pseudomonas ogarae]AUO44669.1 flagellar hook length control protein FliK [Pseudomonas ogarae]
MDIIASFGSSPVASTQANVTSQPQTTTGDSFSSVLSQVSEAAPSNDSGAPTAPTASTDDSKAQVSTSASDSSAPSTVSRAVEAASSESVVADEATPLAALPDPVIADAMLEPVEQPAQAVSTPSRAQLSQQAVAFSADQETALTQDDSGMGLHATADGLVEDVEANTLEGTSDRDHSLEDIRQRMELIESAGQLDPALLVVAPAVQVPAAASQGGVSTDPDASVRANTNLQASSLTAVEPEPDTYQDTPASIEAQGTVLALDGQAANAVQALHRQSDDPSLDSQADGAANSDVQGSFNLASLTLNNTGLGSTDKVVANGLALSSAIGTADWQDGLGQQVIDMIKRGDQQVDLKLNPTELGPLSISLSLSDGNTQAQFQSAHASVRTAVEQALPQLREALASQGISLGQASVSDESSRQASGDQARRDSPGGASMNRTDSALDVDEVPVQSMVVRRSGVDLYV